MDKVTLDRLRKLDSPDFRSFLLLGWFEFFLLAACVYTAKAGLDWAALPVGFAAFINIMYSFRYLAKALVRVNEDKYKARLNLEIAKLEGYLEGLQARVKEATGETKPAPVPPEVYKEREELYAFTFGVVERRLISENDWYNLKPEDELYWLHDRAKYRQIMPSLETAEIVKAPDKPGARRLLLITDFNQALDKIEEYCAKQGDQGFWLDIRSKQRYVRINDSNTVISPAPAKQGL